MYQWMSRKGVYYGASCLYPSYKRERAFDWHCFPCISHPWGVVFGVTIFDIFFSFRLPSN